MEQLLRNGGRGMWVRLCIALFAAGAGSQHC